MPNQPFDQHAYDDAHFRQLELAGAAIDGIRFRDCRFTRCNFSEATLAHCRFSDCEFADCNLSLAKLAGSGFAGVGFTDCKLVGIDWTRAHWPSVQLPGALAFTRCALNDSSFFGLDLRALAMVDCRAIDVDFSEARCEDADFSRSDLRDSLFRKTRLARANFSDARNYRIDVFDNDIRRAKFALPEAISLLDSLDIDLV